MITLYTFGPNFGLPDPSPFVTKVEMLLKIGKLAYRCDTSGFNTAPKGKLPYIKDEDGTLVADSTLVRAHLEHTRGIDFDAGLSPQARATALAFQRLCEEHLYWTVVWARWMDGENFNRGPRDFFAAAPAPVRPLIIAMVRRQVKRDLKGQGIGRHTLDEINLLARQDLRAIASHLGDKLYFMGDTVTGIDATVFFRLSPACCATYSKPRSAPKPRATQTWSPTQIE